MKRFVVSLTFGVVVLAGCGSEVATPRDSASITEEVATTTWEVQTKKEQQTYCSSMKAHRASAMQDLTASYVHDGLTTDDAAAYITVILMKCGLAPASDAALLAATTPKPWYPKGYTPNGTDLAVKWTNESCGYSTGYCWSMRVVSKDGCPDGLYGEVNLEKGGVVVGYTNDTLGSLAAGKTGRLEFSHFGDEGTLMAQLTELKCY